MISIQNYNDNRGIYSPLVEHNGIICGFWMVGNDYRNVSQYYGAYPPNYLKRMKLLFPESTHILHLFSGKVQKGFWENEWTLDVNPDLKPDLCIDACDYLGIELIGGIKYGYDTIFADPPYNDNHLKYNTPKLNKKKVIHLCANYVKPGGHLVWLDTIMPIWAKKDGWKLRGTIGLLQSTNHACRVITILERM